VDKTRTAEQPVSAYMSEAAKAMNLGCSHIYSTWPAAPPGVG